jgi:hypothetical protein
MFSFPYWYFLAPQSEVDGLRLENAELRAKVSGLQNDLAKVYQRPSLEDFISKAALEVKPAPAKPGWGEPATGANFRRAEDTLQRIESAACGGNFLASAAVLGWIASYKARR